MGFFIHRLTLVVSVLVVLVQIMFTSAVAQDNASTAHNCPSVLQYDVTLLESSKPTTLCDFKGQTLLVVNIASGCGFTPQLKPLEALYQKYKDRGLVVIGFPSNSFYQESLEGQEIASFCQLKYGVNFPITAKTPVTGENAHPFFKRLANETDQAPQWNFFKYLISPQGKVIEVFSSKITPDSKELVMLVEQALTPVTQQ